jgi:RNA polymerase sigma-70 factor (ECF subfamily)
MDEQRAIQLCVKHQDPVGFEFLVQKYRREAFVHAFALLGNQDDALDACQDSFAKAYSVINKLPALPKFYPWFYCILRNRCFNLIERRRTSQRYREMHQQEPTLATETVTPSHLLEQEEERSKVHRALESLKPEHRAILVMKYVQDHPYEEIAGILGIPRGTVMSRLYHARMALREAYLKVDRDVSWSSPEEAT